MGFMRQLKKIIPKPLLRERLKLRERIELNRQDKRVFTLGALAKINDININEAFHSSKFDREWEEVKKEIAQFDITGKASGVNYGDRRAIYHLIRLINPETVLEVGTHIGASTTHIAAALRQSLKGEGQATNFTTVDIVDVNDPVLGPWKTRGSTYAPIDMIKKMKCDHFVKFVTSSSIEYLSTCDEKYDLIFLDGDHSAKTVYQEVPAALNLLNSGGYILLHDYFPNHKPLWSNGDLIPGPHLAITRLQAEGASLKVLPFGELPWPTKLNSTVTSLALLGEA